MCRWVLFCGGQGTTILPFDNVEKKSNRYQGMSCRKSSTGKSNSLLYTGLILAVEAIAVMLAWNMLASHFGFSKEITLIQALVIMILCNLLLRNALWS